MSYQSSAPRHTALNEVHEELGAQLTDFAGWRMPLRYGSELAEHHAVRTAAGLFDLSHMGEIDVTGPQAARYLEYALVGRFQQLPDLAAKYTMICADDGGIIDDLIVYRLAPEHFLVVANASNAVAVATELGVRAGGFEVTVRDASEDWSLIAVQGPASLAIMQSLSDIALADVRYYAIAPAAVAGFPVLLARTGYTGEDGFEVFCKPDDAPVLWRAVTEAGRGYGLLPAGLACRDSLRLEAAMPLYGNELSRDLTPFAAGLGRVVALDKEEPFVGRPALSSAAAAETGRVRVGLRAEGRRAPRSGCAVLDATGTVVGQVTSGALSPTLGYPIAMAYVDVAVREPGTALAVDVRGASLPVQVVALPFYKRSS